MGAANPYPHRLSTTAFSRGKPCRWPIWLAIAVAHWFVAGAALRSCLSVALRDLYYRHLELLQIMQHAFCVEHARAVIGPEQKCI